MAHHPEPMRNALSRMKERSVAEFRVVPIPGRRVGIQVERVFWEALTMLGEQAGLKRSELVRLVFDKASACGVGVASALRCVVADMMMEQLLQDTVQRLVDDSTLLLQEAPMPSYAIDRAGQVVLLNAEFVQYVRQLLGQPDKLVSSADVRLEFETPPDLLFALPPGSAALTAVTVTIGTLQRRAMTKIISVPPVPVARLVGYLTT